MICFRFNSFVKRAPHKNEGPSPLSISSENLAEVKAKKEAGTEALDVEGLVKKSNHLLDYYADSIAALPLSFQGTMKGSVLKYFRTSADQYDKDLERGLDKIEFEAYSTAMLERLQSILEEHAPTEAELAAKKEQQAALAEAQSLLGEAKETEIKDTTFDPSKLNTPEGLKGELEKYTAQSQDYRETASTLADRISGFRAAHQKFEAAKKTWGVFLRGGGSIFGWETAADVETEAMKQELEALKVEVARQMQELRKKQDSIQSYGHTLDAAGEDLRDPLLAERQTKLEQLEAQGVRAEDSQMRNQAEYERLEAQQDALYVKQSELIFFRDNMAYEHSLAQEAGAEASLRTEQLQEYAGHMDDTLSTIDEALNGDLPPEKRAAIEAKRAELMSYRQSVAQGMASLEQTVDSAKTAATALENSANQADVAQMGIEELLMTNVGPAIDTLDTTISELEALKIENGTELERIRAAYDAPLELINTVDKAVADEVLGNNLSNAQALFSLEQQEELLKNIEVTRPGLWDATGGLFLGKAGEGLGLISDGLDSLGEFMRESSKDTIFNIPVSFLAEVPVGVVSGLSDGAGELFHGLNVMISHPLDTLSGIGSLIGRSPVDGTWSFETAGHSWKELGKVLVAYEDFGDGHVGKGVGKVAFNVLLTATGIGAAETAWAKAGAAYSFARQAGTGVVMARALQVGTFAGEFAVKFGKNVTELVKAPLAKLGQLFKSLPELPQHLKGLFTKASVEASVLRIGELSASSLKAVKELAKALKQYLTTAKLPAGLREEFTLLADQLNYLEDYAKFNEEVGALMKADGGLTRAQAAQKVFRSHPEIATNAYRYEQLGQRLVTLRKANDLAIYGEELSAHSRDLGSISLYGDVMSYGEGSQMFKRHGLDTRFNVKTSAGRKAALEELARTVKGEELVKVTEWLGIEASYGTRLDDFNTLTRNLKKWRSEYFDKAAAMEDADFQAYMEKTGLTGEQILNDEQFEAVKRDFLQSKLDELFESTGISVEMDVVYMERTLYNSQSKMQKWSREGLSTATPDEIRTSLMRHVDQFAKGPNAVISTDAGRLIQRQLDDLIQAATEAGISQDDLLLLADDCANKIILQTIEATAQQMGDHGVRHISMNISKHVKIMEEYAAKKGIPFTAQERMQVIVAHINHDLGYTASIDRAGFTGTNAHPMIGAHYFERGPMNELFRRVFGETGYERVKSAVINHDGVEVLDLRGMNPAQMQDAAFMNGMKFADNMALFSYEKLPELFFVSPECTKILGQIEQAMQAGHPERVPVLQQQMRAQLLVMYRDGQISIHQTRSLLRAVDGVTDSMTTKGSLGMMAGHHADDFFHLPLEADDFTPVISMERGPAYKLIEEGLRKGDSARFDAGTRQYVKIMEDYAEKNHFDIYLDDELLFAGDGSGDLGAQFSRIKQGIKEGKTFSFKQGGKNKMHFQIGVSEHNAVSCAALQREFKFVTSPHQRRLFIEKGIRETELQLASVERRLGDAIDAATKRKLVNQHVVLQKDLRNLKDLEIVAEIAADAEALRSLQKLHEIRSLLAQGKGGLALQKTDRLLALFGETPEVSRVINVFNSSASVEAKQAALLEMITKCHDEIFTRHNVMGPGQRARVEAHLIEIYLGGQTASPALLAEAA